MQTQTVVDHYFDIATHERTLLEDVPFERIPVEERLMVARVEQERNFQTMLPLASHVLTAGAFGGIEPITFHTTGLAGQPRPGFLNEIVLPMARIEDEAPHMMLSQGDGTPYVGCSEAEWRFVQALEQVWGNKQSPHFNLSVYYDPETRSPLIFRKEMTESTGLTLQTMAVGDSLVPAGTYVGFTRPVRAPAFQTGRKQLKNVEYAAYELHTDFAVRPLRLSPWAYDTPEDSALFAVASERHPETGDVELVNYDARRGQLILEATRKDFQDAAGEIMQLCEVAL